MIGFVILGILVIFIAFILIRTIAFKPEKKEDKKVDEIQFDKDRAVSNLQQLIRCKTVSNYDSSLEDDKEFEKLVNLLPTLYPEVCKQLTLKKFPGRGLLFHWKGKKAGDPAVMMAHYDVVPVNEELWQKPPFEGIIEDGVLWGRGALDTKVTFNGVLTSAEHLLEKGFTPEYDMYFAFSGGEEVNGPGAKHIVEYFQSENITPSIVVDEGGAVVNSIFPGVTESCGLIGIAEKGMVGIKLVAQSAGGHASAPRPGAPVDRLAKACRAILEHPMKANLTAPVALMFDALGRRSTFVYRMIFANLWLFKPVLDSICKKSGGEMNALMRTTNAFTMMSGSKAPNVIPPEASMTVNVRINPADSIAKVVEHFKKVINDPLVDVQTVGGEEPSRISTTECDSWKKISYAVADTWGCIVSPYLMVQCSDSRHYGVISDKVYRFSAMDLEGDERSTIHGNNERIRLTTVHHSVEFYIRLMQQL